MMKLFRQLRRTKDCVVASAFFDHFFEMVDTKPHPYTRRAELVHKMLSSTMYDNLSNRQHNFIREDVIGALARNRGYSEK